MIIKCFEKDRKRILEYIGTEYSHCLYLCLNLNKYGLDSNNIEVYSMEEGDSITAVMLKYYSCLHIYSRDNTFDAIELATFFVRQGYTMIYCSSETARIIYTVLPDNLTAHASISNGWVAQIECIDKEPKGLSVPAESNDFEQIARLIYEDDDIGRSYNYDDLVNQLIQRNKEGYARNLVIKDNDLVIAHACTNAELANIAVVAELLVRKEYRRRGYASEIWRDICRKLLAEGKEVYSFYYSEESRQLHKHIGFFEVCGWSKIIINKNYE